MSAMVVGAAMWLVLAAGGTAQAGGSAAEPAGRKVFVANKCNGCHSIQTQGIGVDEKAVSQDAEGDGKAAGKEVKPPDLSSVGTRHDAKFLDEYLRKQVAVEGRKHKRRFPGSKEERATLIEWLVTLKSDRQ